MNCIVSIETAAHLAAQGQYAAEDDAVERMANAPEAVKSAIENMYDTKAFAVDEMLALMFAGELSDALELFTTQIRPVIEDSATNYARARFEDAMHNGGM